MHIIFFCLRNFECWLSFLKRDNMVLLNQLIVKKFPSKDEVIFSSRILILSMISQLLQLRFASHAHEHTCSCARTRYLYSWKQDMNVNVLNCYVLKYPFEYKNKNISDFLENKKFYKCLEYLLSNSIVQVQA
jgi:hypothetical protein